MFAQVFLSLDEVCLEIHPGLVVFQFGTPGYAVFLEQPCFCNEAVRNSENLSFGDCITCCCRIVDALVEPRIKTLKRPVGVVFFSKFGDVCHEVHGGDPRIVAAEVVDNLERQNSRVPYQHLLEGVEVVFFKHRQYLIVDCGIHVSTVVALTTLFPVFPEVNVFVKGSCPCRYCGCSTGVSWSEKWDWDDKHVLCLHQDKPKVAILPPPPPCGDS